MIFSRIQALGANGRCPAPEELLRVRKQKLRKLGLSFAKAAAVHDLAQKTIEGVVPTLDEAHKMSDQELVDRLISVRGIGAWTVEMFLIFRLGRPDVLPDPRLRRAKRIRPHLPQEKNPQAARTRRVRRTLAPLPHRRKLVHVARHRPRRQIRPQNHKARKKARRRQEIGRKLSAGKETPLEKVASGKECLRALSGSGRLLSGGRILLFVCGAGGLKQGRRVLRENAARSNPVNKNKIGRRPQRSRNRLLRPRRKNNLENFVLARQIVQKRAATRRRSASSTASSRSVS